MIARACNVNVSRYDGDVIFGYDCVRKGRCKFGLLSHLMVCAYHFNGGCQQRPAQLAALKELKRDIVGEIKRLEAEAKEAS